MAVSLEVRAPLLDHRVVELSWRLPRSLKLRGRDGQVDPAAGAVSPRAAGRLVDRPKMGFSVPIDQLAARAAASSGPAICSRPERPRRGGLLDPAPIARAWRRPAGRAAVRPARPCGPSSCSRRGRASGRRDRRQPDRRRSSVSRRCGAKACPTPRVEASASRRTHVGPAAGVVAGVHPHRGRPGAPVVRRARVAPRRRADRPARRSRCTCSTAARSAGRAACSWARPRAGRRC